MDTSGCRECSYPIVTELELTEKAASFRTTRNQDVGSVTFLLWGLWFSIVQMSPRL